ncbi:MAG: hypothetical protein IKD79_04720 [Oscillospiraceae bacterium]|nr:hypothetical protein [Oscillospiraceae bacterium]
MGAFAPELLFCEACWAGIPPYEGCWQGRIYRNRKVLFENRRVLLEILAYCRERGIPTVFWNKEDPTLFGHTRYDFTDTALRFDTILTTAAECVDRYRALGARQVFPFPFGVNTALFCPDGTQCVPGTVLFAGSWFGDQPERCRALAALLDDALEKGLKLDIYDRHSGTAAERFRFPEKYRPYLRPAVPFAQMPALSRRYEWAINVNTVTDSATMCSRRVLQMAACGLKLRSNPAAALEQIRGIEIIGRRRDGAIVELRGDWPELARWQSTERRFDFLLEHTLPQREREGTAGCG